MEERLTAYVPYCLGKIKKLPEWRKSPFAKMSWEEVNSAIISSNQELLHLVADIAKTYKYDSTIITRWIGLRASAVTKDFYIARTVQDLKMHKLTRRVWRDQNHMDFIPKDDSDLTTKALCLAFWTFRSDWFRTIQSESQFSLSKMAQQWLGQQELRRGDTEMANYYLRCASASSEEEYLSECESEELSK